MDPNHALAIGIWLGIIIGAVIVTVWQVSVYDWNPRTKRTQRERPWQRDTIALMRATSSDATRKKAV